MFLYLKGVKYVKIMNNWYSYLNEYVLVFNNIL